MKKFLKAIVPLRIRRWWRYRFGWRYFEGDYASWEAARSAAQGYDDDRIFDRAKIAARGVRAGKASWERDGKMFAAPAVHAPLLAVLRKIAEEQKGSLALVDFGGALGSTWWQHRTALADLKVRWCVVEQQQFFSLGREEFAVPPLSFELTLAAACAKTAPAVILFSSVLQYVENPRALLADAAASGVRHVIIDRTPFWSGGRDMLVVQRNSPALGGGSYPAWIFDQSTLLAPLAASFDCAKEWPGFDYADPRVVYRGLHFMRKVEGV